jgi:hypothetical protein
MAVLTGQAGLRGDFIDRLGGQQLAQLRLAEQLGKQRGIERQRACATFGQRRVALVDERGHVAEQQ